LPGEINFERSFLFNRCADIELQEDVRKYFRRLIKQQGRKRLGIKITGPSRMVFLNSIFINPFFIQIKRSLIPTIHSFLHAPFWRNQGMDTLWWNDIYTPGELEQVNENGKNPVWMTTFQLKKILEITSREREIIPSNQGEILYEDFTANPESEIERLLGLLGLSIHKDCFSFMKKVAIRHEIKPDSFYFSSGDLDTIYSIIG
jgi:hypothetical protein